MTEDSLLNNMPEEELILLDFYNICRICLTENKNMTNLIKSNNFEDISNMLMVIANIEIDNSDTLPCYLCKECEKTLHISYNFKQQCQKSTEIINKYLNDLKMNNEKIFIKMEKCVEKKKRRFRRLEQYSNENIIKAINESKKTFLGNKQCICCTFVGSNSRALTVHMSHLHKDVKETWCQHCNKIYPNLDEHKKEHTEENLTCQFCTKIVSTKGHLTEHLRCHTDERPYKCEVCSKCFKTKKHLRVHLKSHCKNEEYKCKNCLLTFFNDENSLKQHLIDCNNTIENCDDKQNYCKICDKKVRSLNYHVETVHTTQNDKLCTVCGKLFKTNSKLKVHMRIHTGETPYKCSFCSKNFTTRTQLVVHLRVHTGEKPHVCHICGKGFAQSSVLGTHMKIHTGRTEECNICQKKFCRSTALKLHMRKHTGEKPYLCVTCGQTFVQKSHLGDHMRTHSDERPYKCKYCEKAFKQKSSLRTHTQIHLGNKPYRCNQCSYACRQSYSLTKHMAQHNKNEGETQLENNQVCEYCNETFTSASLLNIHMSTVHNIYSVKLEEDIKI